MVSGITTEALLKRVECLEAQVKYLTEKIDLMEKEDSPDDFDFFETEDLLEA
jgi:hypothetical protein